MERSIIRQKDSLRYCIYFMDNEPHWKVVGRRIFSLNRCHFGVFRDNQLMYTLAQTNLMKHAISLLPIVSLIYKDPFYFYQGNERCGYWKNKTAFLGQGIFEFHFNGIQYTVTIHSNGIHSLVKDGVQVAVYKRFGMGNYRVRYSVSVATDIDILILFAAFVENFLTMDTGSGESPESFKIPKDPYIHLARWVPDDDAGKEPFK